MNLQELIQRVQGLGQSIYGQTPPVNSVPSPQMVQNAQIAPEQNPKGVWAILSQVARMRGQGQLASLFAAKEEQERQLKNRDLESQIGARSANADYMKAQAANLSADNERADYLARYQAALNRWNMLTKGEGEPQPVDVNKIEQLPGKGLPAPVNTPGTPGHAEMRNPEVEFPGFKGPGYKDRPPTAGQLRDVATRAKIEEELWKGQNIPEGGRYVNFGLGVDINNPKKFAPEKMDDFQRKFDILKTQHPDWNDEKIIREIANLGDDPLSHALLQWRLDDEKKRDTEKNADIEYYAKQLLPDNEGNVGITANELIRMIPRGYGRNDMGAIYQMADKLSGGKFNINQSFLQGEASLKNVGNLIKADYMAEESEKNYKRMLEDYREVKNAQAKGLAQNVAAAQMDLLARHLALTVGGVTGARVGKDIIEAHKMARGLPEDIEVDYKHLLSGQLLSEQQMQRFIALGEASRDTSVQMRDKFRQAPAVGQGVR